MQFLATLVEHFVVGVVALIWLLPLAEQLSLIPAVKLADHEEILIAVGLPVSYVIGMYVDLLASPLASLLKRGLESAIPRWRPVFLGTHLDGSSGKPYERTAKILKTAPDEAARYLLQLSSREKIARGVALNFIISAVVNAFTANGIYSVPVWLLLPLAIGAIAAWLRLHTLTNTFKSYW